MNTKESTTHFQRWSLNYEEYIEQWYEDFCKIFIKNKAPIPTKKDFYFYCYINTRPYYNPREKGTYPPIVEPPLGYER